MLDMEKIDITFNFFQVYVFCYHFRFCKRVQNYHLQFVKYFFKYTYENAPWYLANKNKSYHRRINLESTVL